MRLKWRGPGEAGEGLARYYASVGAVSDQTSTAAARERLKMGGSLFHTFSLRPDVGYHILAAVRLGHFDTDGHLDQATKQMVATYTAALRSCVF